MMEIDKQGKKVIPRHIRAFILFFVSVPPLVQLVWGTVLFAEVTDPGSLSKWLTESGVRVADYAWVMVLMAVALIVYNIRFRNRTMRDYYTFFALTLPFLMRITLTSYYSAVFSETGTLGGQVVLWGFFISIGVIGGGGHVIDRFVHRLVAT